MNKEKTLKIIETRISDLDALIKISFSKEKRQCFRNESRYPR